MPNRITAKCNVCEITFMIKKKLTLANACELDDVSMVGRVARESYLAS